MVGHTTDDDGYKAEDISDFAGVSPASEQIQAEFVVEVAEKFVEYLREEAAHTIALRKGNHADIIRSLCHQLERDGFDTTPDEDDNPRASVFAPGEFVVGLKQEVANAVAFPDDTDASDAAVSIDGVEVYIAAELDAGELIAIHHDTVVPTPTVGTWKPWLVRHPEGVVVGEVDA